MANIIDFLNRQIAVPEKPNTDTRRTTVVEIPEVGELGFDMDQNLSPRLKQRLEQMAGSFPYDGMTPEEIGTLNAMVEMSTQAVESAKEFVKAAKSIGADTVKMYDLEQTHKENFLGYNNQVQKIDAAHIGALQHWQGKTTQTLNEARTKVAFLKTLNKHAV